MLKKIKSCIRARSKITWHFCILTSPYLSSFCSKIGLMSIHILRKMENMMSVFKEREIADFVFSDEWLGNTMLFIAGPRQCGKTSLVRKFLEEKGCSSLYYNWDIEKVRTRYRKDPELSILQIFHNTLVN